MLVTMLNLYFNNTKDIQGFLKNAFAFQIVVGYDINIVCSFFVKHVFFHLSPTRVKMKVVTIEDEDFFGGKLY
jgi:hypothetical protein